MFHLNVFSLLTPLEQIGLTVAILLEDRACWLVALKTLCSEDPKNCTHFIAYLRYPKGNVGFMKAHGQEEGITIRGLSLQKSHSLIYTLHVRQRSSRLLRDIHCTQQVGMEAAILSFTHLKRKLKNRCICKYCFLGHWSITDSIDLSTNCCETFFPLMLAVFTHVTAGPSRKITNFATERETN